MRLSREATLVLKYHEARSEPDHADSLIGTARIRDEATLISLYEELLRANKLEEVHGNLGVQLPNYKITQLPNLR